MKSRNPVPSGGIVVGKIAGAFGIKGELKIDPTTDFWERFHKGKRLLIQGQWFTVTSYREHKGRPLITINGIDSATKAEALQWQNVEAPAEERPELEEDEYVTEDLLDMEVWTIEGENLGFVEDVLTTPAHDIFVVGKIMIPVVKEFVRMIDFDEERITVTLIPGMLDDQDAEHA